MKSPSSSVSSKASSGVATQRSNTSSCSSITGRSSPVLGDDDYISQVYTFTPVKEGVAKKPFSPNKPTVTPGVQSYASVVAKGANQGKSLSSTLDLESLSTNKQSFLSAPSTAKPSSTRIGPSFVANKKNHASISVSLSKKFKSPVAASSSKPHTTVHSNKFRKNSTVSIDFQNQKKVSVLIY